MLAVLVVPWPSRAQSATASERSLTALRLQAGDRLFLDGRMTEEVWRRAEPASDFRQQEPNNGDLATEPTEVRVLYDEHRIVIGVTCFDSEPGRIMENQMQRDQSILADDRFMVAIDRISTAARATTSRSIRLARWATVSCSLATARRSIDRGTASGTRRRAERDGMDRGNRDPASTINFKPDASSWGINFQRTIRRKVEETLWSGWARNQGLPTCQPQGGCRASRASPGRRPGPASVCRRQFVGGAGRGSPSSVQTARSAVTSCTT
jgi:hypothetical protein